MDLTPPRCGGIYIHIPFCIRKCPYCDFYSVTDVSRQDEFVQALMREIRLYQGGSGNFDTVYFGGGTPSILAPEAVGRILETVMQTFSAASDTEITLEVNPGTVNHRSLAEFRQVGINRLNIGVQSFRADALRFLGRIHTADEAARVIGQAGDVGFDNIGLDLIYGLPDQTASDWRADVCRALEFTPEHLSCYMLTYEAGTPMDLARKQGLFRPLADDPAGDLFDLTSDLLQARGYEHYEISNYARTPSLRSRHNQKYWDFTPYLGFGPSAHAFNPPRRYWNHRDLRAWLADLDQGRRPVQGEERLTREQHITEALYLGLRRVEGIDIREFDRVFGECFVRRYADGIEQLIQMKCIELSPDACRLTRKGMRYLDSIVALLI